MALHRDNSEGLRSEALRTALQAALAGKPAPLEDLLSRHGGGPDPRPNLRLAAAFGAELAAWSGAAAPLLRRLGGDDAAPDTARVFLPMAAAHGWVGRLRAGRDEEEAWAALAALAADERAPVRVATLDALLAFTAREGGGETLVSRAGEWLEVEDRELRFGAAALVVATLSDRRTMATVVDRVALMSYLSRAMSVVADAPRSAERSDARRRLLQALPRTLATVLAVLSAGDEGPAWLEAECAEARHADVREALSQTIVRLLTTPQAQGAALAQRLRQALEGSAKPPRDPSRIRPGAGRGKATRRVR